LVKTDALIVSYPVSVIDKRQYRRSFTRPVSRSNDLDGNVSRLLGSSIITPGAVRRALKAKQESSFVTSVLLSSGKMIAVVILPIESGLTVKTLNQLASRTHFDRSLLNLGLKSDSRKEVDPVAGLVGVDVTNLTELPESWSKMNATKSNSVLLTAIMLQIVMRVSIERSLLTWATSTPPIIKRLFWGAITGYRVRRWPAEILSDRRHHNDLLTNLRQEFNLPSVRAEILERSRSWWALATVLLAILGLLLSYEQGLFPMGARV